MTRAEIELGILLSTRISLLTEKQAEAHGLTDPVDTLCRRGVLRKRTLVFRPVLPGGGPLRLHRPGDSFSFEEAKELSRRALARMHSVTPVATNVYQASRRAYAIWGDAARKKGNPFSFGHDHLLTEIYLRLDPGERGTWRYEPVPITGAAKFEKVPDAAIVGGDGEPLRYHEAVGSYPAIRLLALARHADEKLGRRSRTDGVRNTGIYLW